MKRGAWLLAGSIAANVVLAVVLVDRLAQSDPLPVGTESSVEATKTTASAAPSPDSLNQLRSEDLHVFAANLRAAGFEDRLVRAIITAEIDERFREREEALTPDRVKLPYWRFDKYEEPIELRKFRLHLRPEEPPEIRLARLDIEREKARLRRNALGPEPTDETDLPFAAEKWELAKKISEDYDTITEVLKRPFNRMILPAEQEMMDRLEAEKRAELEALLTPDELAEFEFRTSDFLKTLARELGDFNATEEEFRTIFSLRMKQQERQEHPNLDPRFKPGESDADRIERARARALSRKEEQQRSTNELRTALGEKRYADYQRERDYEYKSLRDMVERMGMPPDTARQVYDLRQTASSESQRIGMDYSKSVEARRATMTELAKTTVEQIKSVLGSEGFEAYSRDRSWIGHLESGLMISFDGNGSSARGIVEHPPPDAQTEP